MVAGLFLGEYLCSCSKWCLDFDGSCLAKRGAYGRGCTAGSGKVVAVLNTRLKCDWGSLENSLKVGVVTPANYNTPSQIVIVGWGGRGWPRSWTLAVAKGAKRLIPLNVFGPFPHTAWASQSQLTALRSEFLWFTCSPVGNTEAAVMERSNPRAFGRVRSKFVFMKSIAVMQDAGVTLTIGPERSYQALSKKLTKTVS